MSHIKLFINALTRGNSYRSLIFIIIISLSQVLYSKTYSTKFPLREKPISESGNWINGKTTGIDWSDVSTIPGLAIGHQPGNVSYTDATALLTGEWGSTQMAWGTVYLGRTFAGDYPEVELRLRSSILAHVNTGYEIAFNACGHTSQAYMLIARWNGPVGDFTYLTHLSGQQYGVVNGDSVKATIIGNTITAYINNVQVAQVSDDTYDSGSPGMGFNFDCVSEGNCQGTNDEYGFICFTASDNIAEFGYFIRVLNLWKSFFLTLLSVLS